jgi:RNA polymerase sigma factor (sigma-70 family)
MKKIDPQERARFRPFWEAEFIKSFQRILRRARKLTRGDDAAAADLVQDVFVRLIRLCPDPAIVRTPHAYLLRMTFTVWANTTRRKARRNEISFEDPALDMKDIPKIPSSIQQQLERDEQLKQLAEACRSPRDEQMWQLLQDGYSIEEIATILDEPLTSAIVRWRRLKQRIVYQMRHK